MHSLKQEERERGEKRERERYYCWCQSKIEHASSESDGALFQSVNCAKSLALSKLASKHSPLFKVGRLFAS